MAAGLGYIEFTTGDILTAAAANGYLASQTVMVFADSAARTSAITSPQEGMISYLKSTDAVEKYNGSAWVGIGGSSSPLTTKGDLYTYSTADARLAVGTNGHILTADSTAATGIKWAAPAGGGDYTRITTQSFSGSSAVNVNDVFSSTYKNYQVFINVASSGVGESLYWRYRVSGADNSTANYGIQRLILSNASFNNARQSGQNQGTLGDVTTVNSNFELSVFNPFESKLKYVYATSSYECANPVIQTFYSTFNGTTSFTGFTVYPSNGTITGEILVYGLKV